MGFPREHKIHKHIIAIGYIGDQMDKACLLGVCTVCTLCTIEIAISEQTKSFYFSMQTSFEQINKIKLCWNKINVVQSNQPEPASELVFTAMRSRYQFCCSCHRLLFLASYRPATQMSCWLFIKPLGVAFIVALTLCCWCSTFTLVARLANKFYTQCKQLCSLCICAQANESNDKAATTKIGKHFHDSINIWFMRCRYNHNLPSFFCLCRV